MSSRKELTHSIKQHAYWEIEAIFRGDPGGGYHCTNAGQKSKIRKYAQVLALPDNSPELLPLARKLKLLDQEFADTLATH
jgi:hypothetical protein